MECRPPQIRETKITEEYTGRYEEKENEEENFLTHEELEEYKKVQEMFLRFSRANINNRSDLRKFLINIIASSSRLLAILEDTPNQEVITCATKNAKANHQYTSYENENSLILVDESIPKKMNRHLTRKNDREGDQIPRVTIKRVSSYNKPGYVANVEKSLHENDECRINNMQKPDSRSSQCIPLLRKNAIQTISQKGEFRHDQLNNETEIVFECKNVEPTITPFAQPKFDYLSQNQLQVSEISEPTRATIKNERLDMVKKEYLDDNVEKLNSHNDCETNGQNAIIPPLNSIRDSNESEKLETCSTKFEMNTNRKVHNHTAPDNITYLCEICGKKFTQKHKLEFHTEVVHNRRKLYQCDTCGKMFVLKNKLDRHINSIHIDLACDASRKTFAQKDYLINHIGSVHNGEKSHECGTRGKPFSQKVAPKEQIESPRRSITHTCDSCGKKFKHKSSLKRHIDFVHRNLKHHKCDRCPKAFSSKSGLNVHMSTVHNGMTYTCDLCEKIFTQKVNLRVHIDIVHMKIGKLFKCDKCQKSFDYKCHLTSHIEYAHKGVTYPCDLCGKVFRHKKNIKLHKDSVHKGITYPCDYCRKVFTQKSHLKVHKDSVHKGIAYPCDQCEKSYSSKTYLKLHIDRIHNGKKPNT